MQSGSGAIAELSTVHYEAATEHHEEGSAMSKHICAGRVSWRSVERREPSLH